MIYTRYLPVVLLALFISTVVLAGESSTMVLRKKLLSDKFSDQDRAYFADTLLMRYRSSRPDSALFFIRKMMYFANRSNDTISIDYGYTHLGSIFRLMGKYDSSVYYYKIALQRYYNRNYEDGIASIYSNLANVYKLQSRYDLAIKNYLEAADVFKKSKNHNALANVYSGLAGLYFKLENDLKAFAYWQFSEEEYAKGTPKEHISHAYRGKCRVYIRLQKFREASVELKKAFETDSIAGNQILLSDNYLLKMELLLESRIIAAFNSAAFDKSAVKLSAIIRSGQMPVTESRYHEFMGDRYVLTKDNEKALSHYDSSLAVDKEEDVPEMVLSVLRKKFRLKLSMSKDKDLLSAFDVLREYEKEVAHLKNERITQETDARYSLKDKEEKIQILNEKNEAANALVEKEKQLSEQARRQNIYLWSGIGLFLIFIIYILITNRKLTSTQKELKKNIEQKDYLFRELNHRVKNNLHIVSSFLSIESHGKTEEIKNILHACENRIHSLGLVHEMLYKGEISENIEVKSYFEKLIQVLQDTLADEHTCIETSVENNVTLHSNKMVLLGLITNELITNSIKYAKAPDRILKIKIQFYTTAENFILTVSDNGIGFQENGSGKDSLGLKLAKGLTKQLNGNFSYENKTVGVEFKVKF